MSGNLLQGKNQKQRKERGNKDKQENQNENVISQEVDETPKYLKGKTEKIIDYENEKQNKN